VEGGRRGSESEGDEVLYVLISFPEVAFCVRRILC
jgi:hypothetical protein